MSETCFWLKRVSGGHFIKRFVSALTNFISYWNPCIWLAESKFVSEKHWQNAWWNAPLIAPWLYFPLYRNSFQYPQSNRDSKRVSKRLWVRLSPFPRVETRHVSIPIIKTPLQTPFETPFSCCCVYHRSLRITITSIQCVPCRRKKTHPWNKGMLWPSAGVYDCSHTFIVKYGHYAFEW